MKPYGIVRWNTDMPMEAYITNWGDAASVPTNGERDASSWFFDTEARRDHALKYLLENEPGKVFAPITITRIFQTPPGAPVEMTVDSRGVLPV